MSRHTILIISADALAAALLGALIELHGHAPHFPGPDEPPRTALRRVRPDVVLVDSDHEPGVSEAFIGPAMMTGARVLIFRTPASRRDLGDLVRGLTVLQLPEDAERLGEVLGDSDA